MPIEHKLSTTDFRRLALLKIESVIVAVKLKDDSAAAGGFAKREPTPLLRFRRLDQIRADITTALETLTTAYPARQTEAEEATRLADAAMSSQTGPALLETYRAIGRFEDALAGAATAPTADQFDLEADDRHLIIRARRDPPDLPAPIAEAVASDATDTAFLGAVLELTAGLRGRTPTADERAALQIAYAMVERGVRIPRAYQGLGTSGFRQFQTVLSAADPGDGHLAVTTADATLLRGTVVHVEHIDRDKEFDKTKVEPYRLPAAINAAKVRLHVGADAPCTSFIGRPVFESDLFARDLLKSAHMTASACTAMFVNGIADCKIGMERMTAAQCIEFMAAVAGNVLRDRSRQSLSAAFNINTPIAGFDGATVTERMAIAQLGIDLAARGGFDKVTWDGASDEVPSKPIIGQMDHAQLVELVHGAHERGLETYISAGLQPAHMEQATWLGVGGVGIGTSLHYIDPKTKLMGAFKPDAILKVLEYRDSAAASALGRGAALLARMDRMFFEGSLDVKDEPHRQRLFAAVRDKDLGTITTLLGSPDLAPLLALGPPASAAAAITSLKGAATHPAIATARRLVAAAAGTPLLAARLGGGYDTTVQQLTALLSAGDAAGIEELLWSR